MHPIHLIGVLVIGLIVGAVAKFLTPGKDPGGCLVTMLLGIAGSFVGTYLGQLLGLYGPEQTAFDQSWAEARAAAGVA